MKSLIALISVICVQLLAAQEVMQIWDETPPFYLENTLEEYIKDSWGVPCAFNVTKPTLTVYPAQGENSGRAMIILPGGGYEVESIIAEGQQIAEYLSNHGITAAVLKYRLPLRESSDQPQLVPLADTRRAISIMKSMGAKYSIDPTKVGVMGFSAGGHLATTASVHRSAQADENPDFSGLIYPVTTLGDENQKWLEETLFHREMTAEERKYYVLVDHVTKETPPAFLLHAYDDDVVPIMESELYASALAAMGQPVEVHYFAKGGHGFGPGRDVDGSAQWLGLLANWVIRQ